MSDNKLGPQWKVHGNMGERKPRIVSKCSCGTERNFWQFRDLPFVGNQYPEDGQEPSCIELRNCDCMSTIAIELTSEGKIWWE